MANSSGAAQDKLEWDDSGNMIAWNVLDEQNRRVCGNGPMVARGIRDFDAFGLELGVRFEDEQGRPMANAYGFWRSRTTYDEHGNISHRVFLDRHGEPAAHAKAGYVFLDMNWDSSGLLFLDRSYSDAQGRPVDHKTRGFNRLTMMYDDSGNLSRMRFFDKNGRLVNRMDTETSRLSRS